MITISNKLRNLFPSSFELGKGDCDWCEFKDQCRDYQIMKGDKEDE